MRFEFATANRILFGPGVAEDTAALMANLGKRLVMVTGSDPGRHAPMLRTFEAAGLPTSVFPVDGEPTVDTILEGTRLARESACEAVIAVGGGSVLDTGKAISGLATNPGDPLDYLEVVGGGRELARAPLPFAAVPTTAGTGSEVTRNAVVLSAEHSVKVSLRSRLLLPAVALVDPLLTSSMPATVTVSSGLDALTHLVEAFVSVKANPLTDPLCEEGVQRVVRSLPAAAADGADAAAREDMSMAGLLGGLALANAGLGAAHGFAAVLGGRYGAPHGLVCGRLLPFVFAANLEAVLRRMPGSPALARFDRMGIALTGRPDARGQDAVEVLGELTAALRVPGLSVHGLEESAFPAVVEAAARSSSMRGNPVRLTEAELAGILRAAL